MRWTSVWIVCSLLASCADSQPPPPEPDRSELCINLRDHLVDLRLQGVDVDRAQHERAQRDALGTEFLDECMQRDDDEIACATTASDSKSVEDCLATEVQP